MKKTICAVLALVLVLLTLGGCMGIERQTWPQTEMAQMLPTPKFRIRSIYDFSDRISASFTKVSEGRYQEYVKACKELGFTLEAEEASDFYTAFNEDGYLLQLDRYGGKNEMDLYFTAPKKMGQFRWPDTEAGRMVPAPPSTYGTIEWEYEDDFCIYVGKMTREDFADYVDACRAAGFDADFRKDSDYFYAENGEGYTLSVGYEGFGTVCISLSYQGGFEDFEDIDW